MKQETLNIMVDDLLKENPDATVKDFFPYVEEVVNEVAATRSLVHEIETRLFK